MAAWGCVSRKGHKSNLRRMAKQGEGTGLGLSISHDIVVKQHAGRIEVDTQPGERRA